MSEFTREDYKDVYHGKMAAIRARANHFKALDFCKALEELYNEYERVCDRNAELNEKLKEFNESDAIAKVTQECNEKLGRSVFIMSKNEAADFGRFERKHRESCCKIKHIIVELEGVPFGEIIKVKCPVCGECEDITDISVW